MLAGMRKILVVGDDYIRSEHIREGFAPMARCGYEIIEANWLHGSMAELSEENRIVEQKGPQAVAVPGEIYDLVRDVELLIVQYLPVPASLIDAAQALRAVGSLRTGLENIDLNCLAERGIMLFNTPGRLAEAVSDYTIGLLIAEARNIARGHAALKQGIWRREYANSSFVPELAGRTVGLVGLGEIGRAVARKLCGFSVQMLAHDPYASPLTAAEFGVELVELDTLMADADFISIHARLAPETHHLIGARELALMKPTAIIVNTARAAIVDEQALREALRAGRIGGAALDVFESEPPDAHDLLLTLDNCTVTPHLAGISVDAVVNSPRRLARAMMMDICEGRPSGFLVRAAREAPV